MECSSPGWLRGNWRRSVLELAAAVLVPTTTGLKPTSAGAHASCSGTRFSGATGASLEPESAVLESTGAVMDSGTQKRCFASKNYQNQTNVFFFQVFRIFYGKSVFFCSALTYRKITELPIAENTELISQVREQILSSC